MEALERRRLMVVAAVMFLAVLSHCPGAEAAPRNTTKMTYVCPPDFIRLGFSCYYFSENKATWQSALYTCKDRDSNLSVPARWEDRNLRNYLNKPGIEKASRWIGGIYDHSSAAWKWGGELRSMHYQSFSKMKKLSPDQLQWHCIAMIPDLLYRWSPRKCIEPHQFICQTKIRKVNKSKLSRLRRRWQRMGNINEITAPSVSREMNDPRVNDVTLNPAVNWKSFDLRPSPLRERPRQRKNNTVTYHVRPRKRQHPTPRRLTRPFPGYQWNRRDPEGSYRYNEQLLRSGRLMLSPQQVKGHLARLRHMRDKQLARYKRLRDRSDWLENDTRPALAHTHARTYTVDNNISALHPKTIVEEFDIPAPAAVVPLARMNRAAG